MGGVCFAFLDDTINFHVATDDGSRLWINDELLIDVWFDQGKLEYSGSIFLEEGKYYPIRLEYYENLGGAVCQLLWSGSKLGRDFIPKSQLFPLSDTIQIDNPEIVSFPNPVTDIINFKITSDKSEPLIFEVFTRSGQLVRRKEQFVSVGDFYVQMNLTNLVTGVYFVKISSDNLTEWIEIYKH